MSQNTGINTHKKYDKSLENQMNMYDNQPYKKDPDLCCADKIKLVSGNVVKYYAFQYNVSEPYLVNTQDEAVKERLEKMQHELDLAKAAVTVEEENEDYTETEETVSN